MKPRLCAMIPAAFCLGCAGGPSVPPTRPAASDGRPASASAGEVARLYNDYLRRLPCPEQAICGTGPELPVTAVRCRPSPAPDEERCIFLVSTRAEASDRIYRCEATFGRPGGVREMIEFAQGCSLASERPRMRFRLTELPGRRTIEEIESGFALQEDLLAGGGADGGGTNGNSGVKVRRLSCLPWEGAAYCRYEADRCLTGETDEDGDGWCRRRARFVFGLGEYLTVSRGWTIDRAVKVE